jgi:glycerol-3-phosphate acyltransferase PlsY
LLSLLPLLPLQLAACSAEARKLVAIEFGLLIPGAYLVGSIPSAYIAAKVSRGIDIRRQGDANVGSTNLLRLTSIWVALPVVIFDLAKGLIMVLVAWLVGLSAAQQVVIGLAVIIGHSWPVFLRFHGGRGVLTMLGISLALPLANGFLPWEIVAFFAIGLPVKFIWHSTPLGILVGVVAMIVVSFGIGRPVPVALGFLFMFLLMVIVRLVAPRTPFTSTVTRRRLLLNRLLFDRDIKDRDAWLRYARREISGPEDLRKPGES